MVRLFSKFDRAAPLRDRDSQEFESLKLAAKRLDDLLKSRGITEDELVEDFQKIRQLNRVKQTGDRVYIYLSSHKD